MRLTDADYLHEVFFESAQFDTYKDYSFVLDEIDLSPTIDAVPVRRGHWEKITGMAPPEFHGHYACSICGWCDKRLTTLRREMDYNFCPNCGADMREE